MTTPAEDELKQMIKDATADDKLIASDWARNMEIVDRMNQHPGLCRIASSQIIRRITKKGSDVALLALPLLESMMKNCPAFHAWANRKDFLEALVEELQAKKQKRGIFQRLQSSDDNYRATVEKQEKILIMIQAWGEAFENSSTYPNFNRVYNRMLREGVRFPEPTVDEVSPVFTPQKKEEPRPQPAANEPQGNVSFLNDDACATILDHCNVLREMLNASDEHDDLSKNDLVQHFRLLLEESQKNVLTRIASNPSEQLLGELLYVNDEIISVTAYYKGLQDGTVSRSKPEPIPAAVVDDEVKSDYDDYEDNSTYSEEGDIEDEQKSLEPDNVFDFLDLDGPIVAPPSEPAKKSPSRSKKPKKKPVKQPEEDDVFIPVLAPPPASNRPARRASTGKDPNSQPQNKPKKVAPKTTQPKANKKPAKKAAPVSNDLFDLLGFNDDVPIQPKKAPESVAPAPSGNNPFEFDPFGLGNAVSPQSNKPAAAAEDDFEDFFAIAMRSSSSQKPKDKQSKKKQPEANSNPFDDLFGQ